MKLHLCAGDVYLKDYINIDIDGYLLTNDKTRIIREHLEPINKEGYTGTILVRELEKLVNGNPNETTLDNYFKFPFIKDPVERKKNKRPFIIDKKMNILEKWDFEDSSIDEIVFISAFEHFWPQEIKNHIIPEICRVLKIGGKLITDFPDIKKQVDTYWGVDDDLLMELIYCNHASKYAIHHYGYTESTFKKLWPESYIIKRTDTVQHDYPMIGMTVIKT